MLAVTMRTGNHRPDVNRCEVTSLSSALRRGILESADHGPTDALKRGSDFAAIIGRLASLMHLVLELHADDFISIDPSRISLQVAS